VKAFVTGGTGFVGAHLVRALSERGDAIRCLVRSPRKAQALGWHGVEAIAGDLTDREALERGCAGVDVVFHVAGIVTARNADEFLEVNRDGAAAVAAAAAAKGAARLVLVSSLSAGGPTVPGAPIDEARPPAPITDYGRSKLAAETAVRASRVPWTIVRPPTVYGEWDREFLKVFKLARLGVVPVFGDGSQELSVIHAEDLARALIAAAGPKAAGKVYYASHPTLTTSRALARAIGRAVARRPAVVGLPAPLARGLLVTIGSLAHLAGRSTMLSADKAHEFLAPAWTCKSDALTRDTGWRAGVDLESGLARTAAWYFAEGWL